MMNNIDRKHTLPHLIGGDPRSNFRRYLRWAEQIVPDEPWAPDAFTRFIEWMFKQFSTPGRFYPETIGRNWPCQLGRIMHAEHSKWERDKRNLDI